MLSSTAQPMEAGQRQRLQLASDRLTNERRDRSMRQMLESARDKAQISYRDGFTPSEEKPPGD